MVQSILKNITDYINYLKDIDLQVSFCDSEYLFEQYMHILLPYNSHNNSYCACVKSNYSSLMNCVKKQKKVFEKSKSGEFFGICWAGVEEYVFPIKNDDTTLAFISISGYTSDSADAQSRINAISCKYQIDDNMLTQEYKKLKTAIPPLPYLRSLVYPLCSMFTLLYIKSDNLPESQETSTAYSKILNYICSYYKNNITLEDISINCFYSKSYISHLFKEKTGYTTKEYIAKLRIKSAKQLLITTNQSVTQIAAAVGFAEPNYFTNVFRKETGMSPTTFRTKNATPHD